MSNWPSDYVERVLKDIEENDSKRKVVKAGLIERYTKKHCSPDEIHPNADDEFSHPDVGPNFEIVGGYVKYVNDALDLALPIFEEPLIVEKIQPDGYRLLNGHHRWFATLRMRVKKVHIQIVNLVHEEDMNRMLEKTNNTRRVVFDLDEVLLSSDMLNQAIVIDSLFEKRIKERLRKGAPEVIKVFQAKGYDVWVYTAGYESEEYIDNFFSMYGLEITGVVNGVNEKRKTNKQETDKINEMMKNKYSHVVHVDNESVLVIDSANNTYDQYDLLQDNTDWGEGIVELIKNM